MATSSYSVTQGAIARHAAHLDATHQDLNSALTRFATSLSDLPKVWQGASFTSFNQVQTKWESAARELDRALTDIRNRVGTSAQLYDAGEADQTAAINATSQSIDWSAGTFRG